MMEVISQIVHDPLFKSAVTGALVAAAVDYHAFRNFKSWDDLVRYRWGLASWRWFQGAVVSAVAGSGISALLG